MNEIVSWKTWKGWKGFLQINSKKIFCFIKFKFQNELFSVKTLPFKSNPSANSFQHIHVIKMQYYLYIQIFSPIHSHGLEI